MVLQQLQKKEDMDRRESDSSGHSQAMAGGSSQPAYAVQGRQLSGWLLEEQHPAADRHH